MRSLFLVLVAACLSGSCSDVTGPTVLPGQEFVLAPGEAAYIANTRTSIAFDGVSGDSRCPINALCIQGGDASVNIRALEDGRGTPYALHTGDMKPVTYGTLTIALVDLQPYPFSGRPTNQSDYRATLKVSD